MAEKTRLVVKARIVGSDLKPLRAGATPIFRAVAMPPRIVVPLDPFVVPDVVPDNRAAARESGGEPVAAGASRHAHEPSETEVEEDVPLERTGLADIVRAFRTMPPCKQADEVFAVVSLFLPTKIANEQFGDAMEDLIKREQRGASPGTLLLKAATAIFWALVETAKCLSPFSARE